MLAVRTLEGVSSEAWPHHAKVGHCHLTPPSLSCYTSHAPQHNTTRRTSVGNWRPLVPRLP